MKMVWESKQKHKSIKKAGSSNVFVNFDKFRWASLWSNVWGLTHHSLLLKKPICQTVTTSVSTETVEMYMWALLTSCDPFLTCSYRRKTAMKLLRRYDSSIKPARIHHAPLCLEKKPTMTVHVNHNHFPSLVKLVYRCFLFFLLVWFFLFWQVKCSQNIIVLSNMFYFWCEKNKCSLTALLWSVKTYCRQIITQNQWPFALSRFYSRKAVCYLNWNWWICKYMD